jgi:hypothetical protein
MSLSARKYHILDIFKINYANIDKNSKLVNNKYKKTKKDEKCHKKSKISPKTYKTMVFSLFN